MTEIWKDYPRYQGVYEVSNFGRVRRIAPATGTRKGKVLKPWIMSTGQAVVTLSVKCKTHKKLVSRLVCEAWHGKPPSQKHQAAHWDGNPSNNYSSNLRWATQSENEDDKKRHGRYNHAPPGSRHRDAKLNESDIPIIRKRYLKGESYSNIAATYKVCWSTIRGVIKKKTWKHV